MNMEYVSIYLVHRFLSSEFYRFSHIDSVHILLCLYLSIFYANVNGVVFLISNADCSLLVYRKAIVFCVLTLYTATLLELLIRSRSSFVDSFGYSMKTIMPSVNKNYLIPTVHILFPFLVLLD